jgi:uridine kinase
VQLSELTSLIRERPGPVRIVAVDGPGGAGKTTFASMLASALGDPPVIHTDDFASWDDPIDWWPRLLEQVIEPLSRATGARYQRYDWTTRSLAEWIEVDPEPVVIIEGVTAGRTEWRDRLGFLIWVETPHEERLRRGLERDGADALDDWITWGVAEEQHYRSDPTRRHADVIVDGTVPVEDGAFATIVA